MPLEPLQVQERILSDWRLAAPGWRAWEPHIAAFTWPVTVKMLQKLALQAGQRVLDVGCGMGDPALAVAQWVGPPGHVVATDPTEEMLATARARAAALKLANIEFRRAAVEEFDAPAGSFDAVAGRWSFIFCVDAVEQLRRAGGWLKPGGRVCVATWTPQEYSPGFAAINAALNRVANLPPLDSRKPGRLQLSEPGQAEEALRRAGFREIEVDAVELSTCVRDGDEFWRLCAEMGGALGTVIAGLPEASREAARQETVAAVERYREGDVLRIPAQAQVASGRA